MDVSGEARHRHGVIALAEALDVFTRVEDDSRVRNFRQILAKPLEMLEVVLADIRSGLHLDAQQISLLAFDDEIDLSPVLVPVLADRIATLSKTNNAQCADRYDSAVTFPMDDLPQSSSIVKNLDECASNHRAISRKASSLRISVTSRMSFLNRCSR